VLRRHGFSVCIWDGGRWKILEFGSRRLSVSGEVLKGCEFVGRRKGRGGAKERQGRRGAVDAITNHERLLFVSTAVNLHRQAEVNRSAALSFCCLLPSPSGVQTSRPKPAVVNRRSIKTEQNEVETASCLSVPVPHTHTLSLSLSLLSLVFVSATSIYIPCSDPLVRCLTYIRSTSSHPGSCFPRLSFLHFSAAFSSFFGLPSACILAGIASYLVPAVLIRLRLLASLLASIVHRLLH